MNHIRNLGAATLMMICVAAPCLAQPATTPPPNSGTASISPSTPSERNPVLADNGDARTSKVVGSDVYNEQDKKLGSVDDILLGPGGTDPKAVLSVARQAGRGAGTASWSSATPSRAATTG